MDQSYCPKGKKLTMDCLVKIMLGKTLVSNLPMQDFFCCGENFATWGLQLVKKISINFLLLFLPC